MVKRIFFLLVLLGAARGVKSQDLILRRDSVSIEAKISEISPEEVRYKRFSNPDGPTYVLPTAEILRIRYANGEVDEFAADPVPSAAPQPAAPAHEAEEYAPRSYGIGDYYERDGVRGLVCAVTDGGRHGLLLSLDGITTHWYVAPKTKEEGSLTKEEKKAKAEEEKQLKAVEVGASDKSDGANNMEAVARYVAGSELDWEEFPAFAWCRELGEGWYLPSIDEWLTIAFNFNGGSRNVYNRQARVKMNDALKEHGGKRLDGKIYYFSSTEQDAKTALGTHLGTEPPYVTPLSKSGITFSVRAVRKF